MRGEAHPCIACQRDGDVGDRLEEHSERSEVRNGEVAPSGETGVEEGLEKEGPHTHNAEHRGVDRRRHAELVAQIDRIAGIATPARPGRAELQEEAERHDRLEMDLL